MRSLNPALRQTSIYHGCFRSIKMVPGLVVAMLMLLTAPAGAQVADYTFAQEVSAYTPITGGTVYGTPISDDQRFVDPAVPLGGTVLTGPGLPIGFTFTYNGIEYDRLGINTNGWISLGTTAEGVNMTTTSAYTPLASTSAITPSHLRNRISAMGRDIVGGFAFQASGVSGTTTLTSASSTAGIVVGSIITGTGLPTGTTVTAVSGTTITVSAALTANSTNATYTARSGELRLETIGVAPNRVTVVQWTNFKRFSTTGNNDNLNFQIRLYETTNLVEVKYGVIQFGAGTSTGTSAIHVGLGGAVATDFNNRQTNTNWNTSVAGTANNVGMDVNAGVVYPVNGLTFQWTPSSCPSPGSITFSALSPNSVTANWNDTGADSYTYELRTSGAAGSGPVGLVTSGNTTATTVDLTGLTSNTSYVLHVHASCGAVQSNWGSAAFTTPCDAIVAPYVETFDGVTVTSSAYVTPPSCWNNFSSAGAHTSTTNVWRFANGTGTPATDPDYGVENVTDHTSGSGFFAWYDGSFGTGVTNVTLESPLIDMSALTTAQVRFYLYSNNTNDAALNSIELHAYDGSTWVQLLSHQGNAAQWIELSALIPAGIPTVTRFRIVVQPSAVGSPFYNDLLVDDFAVIEAPTCFPPEDVSVSNITTTSVEVSFTTNASTSYDYEVRTSGGAGSGAAGLVTSGSTGTSPFTITDLPSGTNLAVYLRGVCPDNDLSDWTQAVNFSTLCSSFDVPYTENFNSTPVGTSTFLSVPNCWTIIDNAGSSGDNGRWNTKVAPTTAAFNSLFTGNVMQFTYSSSGSPDSDDWLITPGLELTGGVSYQLDYILGHNSGTSYNEKMKVVWGTGPTPAELTEVLWQSDSINGTTAYPHEWHFTPPATGVYYIGWHVFSIANQYNIYLDDVSISTSPVCATTSITSQENCANDEFSLIIGISDMGTATAVTASYTVDYEDPVTVVVNDGTVIGPFPETSIVQVSMNNGFASCDDVDMGSFHATCPIQVDCASTQPVSITHCYENNDTRVFTFIGSDPDNTLDLKFIQGSFIASGDGVTFWSGYPGTGTQINTPPAGSDLSTLGTIQSTGNILSVSIQSDGSESCGDGSLPSPWQIQVRCSGCIEPMGDVVSITDCATYSFNVFVDLYYLGYSDISESDATSAGIRYTVDGGAPTELTGLTEDMYDLGSFPIGSVVNVVLVHVDGDACSNFTGNIIESEPCPPANDACTTAGTLTIVDTGGCPAASITGTTLYADMTGSMPACVASGTVQDVWYSFNTNGYMMPLSLTLTTGTAENLGYQVFSACGTPVTGTGSCSNAINGSMNIPGLAQNTTYLLRVFTRTNLGTAGSFNVCISGTSGAALCDGALNIPSVPVNAQALVCQTSNQLNVTSVPAVCGSASNSYKGGVEALYTYTPTSSGSYQISIAGQTWTSIYVYANACPSAGGACVASVGTSASSKSLTVDFTAGTTYYIWFDTYPSPASPCPGTFSIVQILCPAPTAVSGTPLTNTTANVNWTGAAGTYIIEYGPSSIFTTPGVGVVAGTNGTIVTTTAPPPYTLDGLWGNTQYRVFVRRDCTADGNGFSSNSTAALFTTLVNPPMTPTCGNMWYDTGGPASTDGTNRNYGNNENYVVTVCPPAGQVARITFSAFNTEANWDRLHVYNGPDTSSSMFASANTAGSGSSPYGAGGWWGDLTSNLPGPFTSSDPSGCLTFAFWSDGGGVRAGWEAMIDCIVPVTPPCVSAPTAPADGSSACAGPTTLSWPAVAEATGYDVYLDPGPAATTLVSSDQLGTTFNAGSLAAGTYTWMVVPRSAAGAATDCPSWTFTKVAVPVATAANNGPVCAGEPIELSASSGEGATYSWTGPSFTSDEQNPVIPNSTTGNSGTYNVVATISGCPSAPASTSVSVQASPTGVTASASSTSVCAGDTVDLSSTGTATGILLNENFNGPTNNWVTTNTGTGGDDGGPSAADWTLRQSPYTYSATTFSSNDASQFYMTNSDAQGQNGTTNTTLRSPAFSLVGYTTATLNFRHFYQRWASGDILVAVQASIDGSTWTTVQSYTSTQGTASNFALANLSLNAYVGEPTVYVRYLYNTVWGYWWAIDNVVISGQTSPSFVWSSTPAGFNSTEQNPQDVVVNATTTYTVTASNALGCSTSADVTVMLDDADTDGDGISNCEDNCPELPGQIGDTCDDGDPNTTGDTVSADCECIGTPTGPNTENVTLEVTTDANGEQTSWEILAQGTNAVMCEGEGFPSNATVTVNCALPQGCFVLRVYDSAGDGITGGGYILRTFPENHRIIDNRNNFTTGSVSAISGDQGFCLPIGDDRLIYTSCDKMDWVNNQFIVASMDPAVSAMWVPGAPNSQQSTTSGYEFWFFDPNGSYSFRKFRNHATSDGFGPANAARAAHLQLNNWGAVNHIPTGVMMNVRVRSVVEGVPAEWGPACRFMIDPVAAECPVTKLMDIPGNQFLSCDQYREWGTGNYVHARPVSGATQYQFRFRQPGEGYEVVRTTNSYFVQLYWTVPPPLQTGSQYQVDVRAFKNGAWCPWGDVCSLNIGQGMQGGGLNSLLETEVTEGPLAELSIWPNPNRGDLLYMDLDRVPEEVLTVSIDIFDLFGKRILARQIATHDGHVNTVLDLKGDLPAGMYMVNLTAGEKVYTQRLVVQR